MKQFVLPFDAGPGNHRLTDRDFHYLIRVRRYTAGDRIPALSRTGEPFEMEIISVARDSCTVALHQADRKAAGESGSDVMITLMPALTKGRKLDLTVRQAVEAGATAIWPVVT
jgi:RsmE family RNA methyltransferase